MMISESLSQSLRLGALTCLLAGLGLVLSAGYIQSKAQVAQILMARAYQHYVDTNETQKPWPWADTKVIAKLIIKNHDHYILAGANLRNLAFGPAHMSKTALPGTNGNSVIVGHRDTHFEKLKDIRLGEIIQIERDGKRIDYRVAKTMIVHESQVQVTDYINDSALTLITCYPFNSVNPKPERRFVVRAIKLT